MKQYQKLMDRMCSDVLYFDPAFLSAGEVHYLTSGDQAFYEVLLPSVDDALLAGLSGRDFVTPEGFNSLFSFIFDADGNPLSPPRIDAIRCVRQLSRAFKKVFEVCDDVYVQAEVNRFRDIDAGLRPAPSLADDIGSVNAALHGTFLLSISQRETHAFRHGPGAVSERLDSRARWDFPSVSRRIASRFYPEDFYVHYQEDWPCDVADPVGRLIAVPKVANKPRLISIEPAASMYAQQGVLSSLDDAMRHIPQINMRDQSRNRALAKKGSYDGSLATIDLSEASDRLSLSLVERVFRLNPGFLNLLADCRTGAVDTSVGRIVLNKYASMGSALTFPVQMLVFRSIAIFAICAEDQDLSVANIRRWGRSDQIGIFGDDIIVPTRYALAVCRALEAVGLKVNVSKSFFTGLFRESCGGDFYLGQPVQPVYLRRRPPTHSRDVTSIISWAATSLLMDGSGFVGTAKYLSDVVQSFIGPCPPGDGAISVSHPWPSESRYNPALQRHEVKCAVAVPKRKRFTATSDDAILAHALTSVSNDTQAETFLAGGSLLSLLVVRSDDAKRLTHHGRPTSAFISRRWVGEY